MSNITWEQLNNTLRVIDTALKNCVKIQPKFKEGTSQASLLRNRIKALHIAGNLAAGDREAAAQYTDEELKDALPPIISIRNKNLTARSKYDEGTTWYKRFTPQIEAMEVAEALIRTELEEREECMQ